MYHCFHTEQTLRAKFTRWDENRVAIVPVKALHGEEVYFVSNSPLLCQIGTAIHIQKKELLLQNYKAFRLPEESSGYNLRKQGHVLDTVSCTMVSLSLMY